MEHQITTPTSSSATDPVRQDRDEQLGRTNHHGAITRFATNHPLVTLGAALGLGFAFGFERHRIWSGTRWLGSTCRDAGVGAWQGAVDRLRR